jgi:transposase
MDTVHSAITEPVRRLEVFTEPVVGGSGATKNKARIVAEIVASGDSVCAVARRHGLSPQQLFGWRRQLRESATRHSEAEELQFVPAVVDVVTNAPALRRQRKRRDASLSPISGRSSLRSTALRSGSVSFHFGPLRNHGKQGWCRRRVNSLEPALRPGERSQFFGSIDY